MKLLRLSLKGFRQHKNTELEFKSGLTGIIGPNGSGKSTIIEGIAFSLFGSRAIRGKLDGVRTSGLSSRREVRAALTFEHEGTAYHVERSLNDAALYLRGESEPFTRGNTEVSAKICSIFAMNYEEFSATFFTEQKGLEFLSGKKGAVERERFIVRLLGYDKLQEIQELLRSDRKDKRSLISIWQANLGERETLLARLSQEEAALKIVLKEHDEAVKVLEKAENEVVKSLSRFESLDAEFTAYQKAAQAVKDYTLKSAERSSQIDKLERRIADKASQTSKLQNILSKLEAHGIKYDPSTSAGAAARLLEAALKSTENDRQLRLVAIGENKSAWLERKASLKSDLANLKSRARALAEQERNSRELDTQAPCPTCGQELGDSFESLLSRIESEAEELSEKIRATEELYRRAEFEPHEVKEKQAELEAISRRIETLRNVLREITEIEFHEKEASSLKDELATAMRDALEIKNCIQSHRETLSKLNFSESEHQKARARLEHGRRLLEVARLQRVKIEGDVGKHQALHARTGQLLAEYDRRNTEIDEQRRQLAILEQGDQVLSDLRTHLNSQIRPRLSELAGEFLGQLSDGRYNTVEIGPDFTPRIVEDGAPKMIISGGEDDLLNLCMRLALSNMLAERSGMAFSTLILDEVFGALDENRRYNVLLLLERLSTHFEQILIITHLEDIREGVHNLVSIDYNDATSELIITDQLGQEDEQDLAFNF